MERAWLVKGFTFNSGASQTFTTQEPSRQTTRCENSCLAAVQLLDLINHLNQPTAHPMLYTFFMPKASRHSCPMLCSPRRCPISVARASPAGVHGSVGNMQFLVKYCSHAATPVSGNPPKKAAGLSLQNSPVSLHRSHPGGCCAPIAASGPRLSPSNSLAAPQLAAQNPPRWLLCAHSTRRGGSSAGRRRDRCCRMACTVSRKCESLQGGGERDGIRQAAAGVMRTASAAPASCFASIRLCCCTAAWGTVLGPPAHRKFQVSCMGGGWEPG